MKNTYRTQYSYNSQPETPARTQVISKEEIMNLVIDLNTSEDVLDFLAKY